MDFTDLMPAGMQNPRIKQYLSIKQNTKSNPENLVCLEGLWEISTARTSNLDLRAFFVCPELLKGDTGRHLAEQIVNAGVHSYLVSEKVMHRISDRDEPDGLAVIAQLPRFAGTIFPYVSSIGSSCSTVWKSPATSARSCAAPTARERMRWLSPTGARACRIPS